MRVIERFAGVNRDGPKALVLQSFMSLDISHSFIKEFSTKYPALTMQLFASKDKAFFLPISQYYGQEPVPFISILDASFEVWFKKVYILFVYSDIFTF